ncbi:hypothetical protein [Zunongwangia sp.]|uniref:hypothetical protein n=1 Tax=Zunongwangia sp. TaxID=1965325 RepID=UPI003AA83ED7
MKKIFTLLFVTTFLLTACDGDTGPQGPPGEDGYDNLGFTFERTFNFDYFSDGNGFYSHIIQIPEEANTINPDADAVLVYRLERNENSEGNIIDTWSLIPKSLFTDQGNTVQYSYNHTPLDVEIIIDGNFDLNTLDSGFINDQTFRVIIIPSDFLASSNIDVTNYEAVSKAFNITDSTIQNIKFQQ